ncbi:3-hydroxyacyl-CoA dehydrogenase NAD-binding domain-containing protein [Gordonia liuliyuniae]|uniref:3-hydroxyacyl-CoA dehydrogenase NAD-binding domain-containing protein n=1 Tax=Gordonia liuliyuniae TaxID=2911517 RepID=A0ABS9IWK2_9ACTN|nr:3-hydroxyacyl-CoA dehydrogenase NAD-binding domain-containing protein [Gordonia liuliyuniae]MCF8589857.1 3-hydroxyacyl-CoA dehydrogenase NAD-binding domain-containing protein [Gordonia liuliyuniae]
MSEQTAIRWEKGDDGIVVLTLDDPGQSANTMNDLYQKTMQHTVTRIEAEKGAIRGVVITSAKKTFFAGGDLRDLSAARPDDAARLFDEAAAAKNTLRRLETLGRPVVAALNGSALGGGLEIALACHHRIAVAGSNARFGLPEVTLGLLPGAGGIVRTVRMLGIEKALHSLLLQGQRLAPAAAVEVGIVDELVEDPEQLLERAKAWIRQHPDAGQPWDTPGYAIPGGTPANPSFAAVVQTLPSVLRKQLRGAPYLAPRNIVAAAVEGTQVDVDTALRIENRYFVDLLTSQMAKNMIQGTFFDMQTVAGGHSRPGGHPTWNARKVAVVGAGMMGAGIAYCCARAGLEVVLKDVTLEAAEVGKAYSAKIVDKAVTRGQLDTATRDAVLDRITATTTVADCAGADLVIEAVFENPDLKAAVFAELELVVADGAVLGSNTSTLPITGLAEAVSAQENFIGLHFFSPVDKMPLLEIISGARTSDATLAKAFDLALQIKKTPIVVNDSRGFFTSRVIGTRVLEGLAMLGEGVDPISLERATTEAGYPVGVLQISDELNLQTMHKIRTETLNAAADTGAPAAHPGDTVIAAMLELGRPGRAQRAGFFDYDEHGTRTRLWPGVRDHVPGGDAEVPFEDIKERLLFVEALESVRCLEEGVLISVADANVGSLLGIGYPTWTGGVLQYINGYPGGVAAFAARAEILAKEYGDRFAPPALLIEKASTGSTFA